MTEIKDKRIHGTRHILFNLTHPDESLILRGPLAKEAGGFGSCVGTNGAAVFANKDDPDYRVLLGMCEAGKRRLDEVKRFDMPGFKPREAWVREMKRFGMLPGDFDVTKQTVDVYEVERRYWESFEWQRNTGGEQKK
jgi:hypothetical protein